MYIHIIAEVSLLRFRNTYINIDSESIILTTGSSKGFSLIQSRPSEGQPNKKGLLSFVLV